MKDKNKERTHRLIKLGGLVAISGLDELDEGQLLGLLLETQSSFEKLPKIHQKILKIRGWEVLRERKRNRTQNKGESKVEIHGL